MLHVIVTLKCGLELRGHSRSLNLVPFKSYGVVSYSPWHYLVSFARYSDLSVENREIIIPHLYLAPPQGVTPSEFCDEV